MKIEFIVSADELELLKSNELRFSSPDIIEEITDSNELTLEFTDIDAYNKALKILRREN